MKRTAISFWIGADETNILEFMKKIDNKSAYLKNLILNDMKKDPFTEKQVKFIEQLIDKKLKNNCISSKENNNHREEKIKAIDELLETV